MTHRCALLFPLAVCAISLVPARVFAQVPEPLSPAPEELPPTGAGAQIEEGGSDDLSALAKDGHPLSGWHNGLFFLRDYNDNFRLYIQGRAQIDTYTYFGSGVSETSLKPTMFLRRVRPEVSGEFFHKWWFMIAGDFGATALDNPNGTNETSAAAPGAAPTAATARYASAQTPKFSAAPTDVFLNYEAYQLVNIQAGQFDAPFTMENRTSDKYFPFIERSLAVRVVGLPTNKEIGVMAWGQTEDRFFNYAVGLFDGDGQNRLNTDSRGDLMTRIFFRPLSSNADEVLKNAQVGASFRYGSRDKKSTAYDYPAMTTQANYPFWNPTYTGANGLTHILPSGDQIGVAGELRVPISMFDLTSEFVYIRNNTREALDGFQATNTERFGEMKGYSYYVQFGAWPIGKRDINGVPGDQPLPHLNWKKPDSATPPHALQLLVKWEQLALSYDSASRDGTADAKNVDGDIKVNAFSLGANYWYTKHIRLSLNYVLNMFPDSAPTSASSAGSPTQTSSNRAQAPGNTIGKGIDDESRDTAHVLHEVILRFAVAL